MMRESLRKRRPLGQPSSFNLLPSPTDAFTSPTAPKSETAATASKALSIIHALTFTSNNATTTVRMMYLSLLMCNAFCKIPGAIPKSVINALLVSYPRVVEWIVEWIDMCRDLRGREVP